MSTVEQNLFIASEKQTEILLYKLRTPTKRWRRYEEDTYAEIEEVEKSEDDILYYENTLKFFDQLDRIFDEFVDEVAEFTKEKDAIKIYAALKKTIFSFNKLNATNPSGIQTMERDGICEFLTKVIQLSGFHIHENENIIEYWREW